MFQVYVLKSVNKKFHYIGHTGNLEERLKAHNGGKVRSTKGHRPLLVIYTEEYETRGEAQRREIYLKRSEGNIWLREKLKRERLW